LARVVRCGRWRFLRLASCKRTEEGERTDQREGPKGPGAASLHGGQNTQDCRTGCEFG
jgi:hypothetical protein